MSTILGNSITLGGGGAKLNIDFGTTPPSDTSKLWVPLNNKPNNISLQTGVDSGDFAVKNISVITETGASSSVPQFSGTAEDGEGGFYCFGGGEGLTTNRYGPKSSKHIWHISSDGIIQMLSQELLYKSASARCARVGRDIYIFGGGKNPYYYNEGGLPMIQKFNIDTKETELIWSYDTQYTSSAGGPWLYSKLFKWGDRYLVLAGGNKVGDPLISGESSYGRNCIRFYDTVSGTFTGGWIKRDTSGDYISMHSSYPYAITKNAIAGGTNNEEKGYVYDLEKRTGKSIVQNVAATGNANLFCGMDSIPVYFLGNSYTILGNGNIYEYLEETNSFSTIVKTVAISASGYYYSWCYNDDGHVFIPNGGTIFDLAIKTPLTNNNMIIALDIEGAAWKALNTKDISAIVYPIKVLVGDATGYAETKDAYLYDRKTSKWTKLDGSSTYQDMLNALNIMGVN